ncbi:hypothetical protein C9J85_11590 [Haloferax sp. wsp5]|nr:hypothetical protein C9J85_11590 [Haloferax sp. wsp5]
MDALVASPEAKAQRRAYELSQRGGSRGSTRWKSTRPPFVVADDGTRTAVRIPNGEIDVHGRLLTVGGRCRGEGTPCAMRFPTGS